VNKKLLNLIEGLLKDERLSSLQDTPEFMGARGDLLDMDKVISEGKDLIDRWQHVSKKQENILSCYLSQGKIKFIGGQNG
jgi:hypothetical protein